MLFEPTKSLRLGLGYQSAMKENLKGTATFTVPPTVAMGMAGLAQINPTQTAALGAMGDQFAAGTANGPVTAELNLPSMVSLGMAYDVSSTVTICLEAERTQWSKFQELRLKFPNPAAQADNYTTENWKDTNFFSVGASYHPSEKWTWRVGLAMDQAPVDDAFRTPRIPDADRTWVSAGLSYQFTKGFAFDFGYTHILAKDSTVGLVGGTNPASPEFFKGNLNGTYKNSIDIWACQVRWAF